MGLKIHGNNKTNCFNEPIKVLSSMCYIIFYILNKGGSFEDFKCQKCSFFQKLICWHLVLLHVVLVYSLPELFIRSTQKTCTRHNIICSEMSLRILKQNCSLFTQLVQPIIYIMLNIGRIYENNLPLSIMIDLLVKLQTCAYTKI